MRLRRYTLHSAAVLHVVGSTPGVLWAISDVADACGIAYSSARVILVRLFAEGALSRVVFDGGRRRADPVVHFEVTPHGQRVLDHLRRYMPDPVAGLTGWQVDNAEGESASLSLPAAQG